MKRTAIVAAAAAMGLAAFAFKSFAASGNRAPPADVPTWEYLNLSQAPNEGRLQWDHDKEDRRTPREVLNAYGHDGWELVSVTPLSLYRGSDWSGKTSSVEYFLKRPIRGAK